MRLKVTTEVQKTVFRGALRCFFVIAITGWLWVGISLQAANDQAHNTDQCRIQQTDEGCVMENHYLKITINRKGGRVTSMVHKASGKEYTADLPAGGVFKDMILRQGCDRDFWETSYELNVKENSAERAVVELSESIPKLPFLKIYKTFTLCRDRSDLLTTYRIENLPAAMASATIAFRNHNYLKVNGEKNLYFIPTSKGVQITEEGAKQDVWHKDVVRGWAAFMGEKSHVGLACSLEYRYLDSFYNCFGPEPTLEWFYRAINIEDGDSFRTQISLFPFQGINAIDGVKDGLIAGFSGLKEKYVNGEPIEFSMDLASSHHATLDMVMDYRILPSENYQVLERKSLSIVPDATSRWALKFQPSSAGTLVLRCCLRENGKSILTIYRSAVAGQGSGTFAQQPEEEKSSKVEDALKAPLMTRNVETPHIPWARPWHQGRPRVLFVAFSYVGREVIELAQRLDMDFETALMDYTGGFGSARYYQKLSVADCNQWLWELLKKDYDTIVICGNQWTLIDEKNRMALVEKVKKGTGMVMISLPDDSCWRGPLPDNMIPPFDDSCWQGILPIQPAPKPDWQVCSIKKEKAHFIVDGIPVEILPPVSVSSAAKATGGEILLSAEGHPVLGCHQNESNGRVVVLNYCSKCLTPISHPWGGISGTQESYPYWEYFHALVAKAVLWTSHKEGDLNISSLETKPQGIAVSIASPTENGEFELDWDIRDDDNRVIEKANRTFRYQKGRPLAILPFPDDLPNGISYLNLRVLEKGKVKNFGACVIQKDVPVKIMLTEPVIEKQDNKVCLKSKAILEKEPPEGASLRIELSDAYGRIVARKEIQTSVSEKEYAFQMDFISPLTRIYQLKAELTRNNISLGKTRQQVCLKIGRPSFNDYHEAFFMLNRFMCSQPAYLQDIFGQIIGENGFQAVDLSNTGKRGAEYADQKCFQMAEHGIATMYLDGKWFKDNAKAYAKSNDKKYLIRKPCLNDPLYLDEGKKQVEQMVGAVREYEPKNYIFGDENSLTSYTAAFDFCFCPHCLKGLREWLKTQYQTLESLNAAYQSQYRDFNEVMPFTTQEAKERQCFAPWMDHRQFMDETVAKFYADKKALVQQLDPGARVGLCGLQLPTAYNGMNYDLLMNVLAADGVFVPYSGPREYIRSFAMNNTRFIPCVGYRSKAPLLAYWQWWNAFAYRGAGYTFFTQSIMLNEDFTRSQQLQDVLNASKDLRNGVGKLLLTAQKAHDGIAILYSQNSLRMATILDEEAKYNSNSETWWELLNEAGWQWNYVRSDDLKSLTQQGYRLLILPFCLSLAKNEIAQLKEFVMAGGVVVADTLTGLFDEHGTPYSDEVMREIFGIRRPSGQAFLEKRPLPKKGKLSGDQVAVNGEKSGMNWSIPVSIGEDAGAAGGKVLAKVLDKEVLFVNAVGKGKGIFLNFGVDDYANQRATATNQSYLSFMKALFEIANVQRSASPMLLQKSGLPSQHCRVFTYKMDSDQTYYGLIRDLQCPLEEQDLSVQVLLKEKRHVYDVRNHAYLGFSEKVEINLPQGDAALLAAFPYAVKGVEARLAQSRIQAGETVSVTVRVHPKKGSVGTHVVLVEVTNPEGKLVQWYSKNLVVPPSGLTYSFPTALNDLPGDWKLKATEVASGRSTTVDIIIGNL